MYILCILMLLILSPSPANADDAMEAQRCIWRCASSTGSKQPAYDQCIKQKCDVESENKRKSRRGWREELNTSVQASIMTLSNDGLHRLDIICGPPVKNYGVEYSILIQIIGKPSRIEAGSGNLFADHEIFPVEIGGTDDGWALSNDKVGEHLSIAPKTIDAIANSSELQLMSGTIEVEPAATFSVRPNSSEFARFLKRCRGLKY